MNEEEWFNFAKPRDIIKIMEKAIEDGYGEYYVTCNAEYRLTKEDYVVNGDAIDIGGLV